MGGPGKGAGQSGQSVPLEGEAEITAKSSGVDILTLTAPSTHDADFIVCRKHIDRGASGTGTEVFAISSAGALTLSGAVAGSTTLSAAGLATFTSGVTISTGTLTVNAGTWTSAGVLGTIAGTFSGSGSFSTLTISSGMTITSGTVACGSALTASGLVTCGSGLTVSTGTLTAASGTSLQSITFGSSVLATGATVWNLSAAHSGKLLRFDGSSLASTIQLPTVAGGLHYTLLLSLIHI